MNQKRVGDARRGNYGVWDARAYPADPDKMGSAILRWLLDHPEEVSKFNWVRPFDPVAVRARLDAPKPVIRIETGEDGGWRMDSKNGGRLPFQDLKKWGFKI